MKKLICVFALWTLACVSLPLFEAIPPTPTAPPQEVVETPREAIARPFPQHVTYAPNSILPNRRTQEQLDDDVRAYYDYWKANYVAEAGTHANGVTMYRVVLGKDEDTTRSFVFATLLASNVLLTLANRSFEHSIRSTIFYKNNLLWLIIGVSTAISAAILWWPPLQRLFHMGPITLTELGWCLLAAIVSVGWFEVWKWMKKHL